MAASRIVTATAITEGDGGGGDGFPVIVTFETPPPEEILQRKRKKSSIAVFAPKTTTTTARAAREVIAETKRVMFRGDTASTSQLPMRHALCVRDADTGDLALFEVPAIIALHKTVKPPSSGGDGGEGDDEEEEEERRRIAEGLSLPEAMSYNDRRALLTEAFGNRRRKVQMKTAAANAMPDKVADVEAPALQEAAAAAAEGADAPESEEAVLLANGTSDLPPLNAAATTPDAAYALSDIITPGVWDEAMRAAYALVPLVQGGSSDDDEAFDAELAKCTPAPPCKYVAAQVQRVLASGVKASRLQSVLAALILINDLVRFDALPLGAIRTKATLAKNAKTMHISTGTMMALAQTFLESSMTPGRGAEYRRTAGARTKISNHIVVLALFVEGWTISTESRDLLAEDLRCDAKRVTLHIERVGCTKKRLRTTDGHEVFRWTLNCPVKISSALPRLFRRKSKL
jgi:hypothetical protein